MFERGRGCSEHMRSLAEGGRVSVHSRFDSWRRRVKMGKTRKKLKRNKNGKKFAKDRVLRGKIICNRSSGSMRCELDGKGSSVGIDRCYVAMKKLENWRNYSFIGWS